jgi:hypothetical protein
VVLIDLSKDSAYARPYVDASLLTKARLTNWRTSQMLVADWVATFSLYKGDLERQQPAESFAISEFTSWLQASYQMIRTPKQTWFLDPKNNIPIKSKFRKLPVPSPDNLGPSRDLLGALREHQTQQLKSACVAIQVAQIENLKEAAQLARLQTAVVDKVNVL